MAVFKCTLPDGAWENIDAPVDCLAELAEALAAGPVVVDVLVTRRGAPGERIVTRRLGKLITARTYTAIQDASVRFVEEAA